MRRLVALLLAACALGLGARSPAVGAQRPANPPHDAVTYVALGDSFTSGPLVPNQVGTPIDCARSDRNYPRLVAAALGVAELRDVSCGSATIDHFYEPQDGLPLGGVNPPQFAALDAGVDVVTVGVGGNDVGYVGLALDCVRLLAPPLQPPCTPQLEADGTDAVTAKIAEVGPELGKALRDIRRLAPAAEVFVVGYPASLPDTGVACWPYVPILPRDMPYLVAKYKDMNAMLAAQAAANGATYVDIYTPSIGHDACQLLGTAWVNGVLIVPLSFPAHPNALSYRNSAPVITEAIRAALGATREGTGAERVTGGR
ncbi:SGNH/GDSL hydrolase family protein [soil metagenome]